MRKILLITLSLLFLTSCSFFRDPKEKDYTPNKGYADYYKELIDMDEVLKRPRVSKKIGNHELLLPSKTTFKYGNTRNGGDEIFGKKRRYFYDESKGLGEEIYFIDDTMENLSLTKNGESLNYFINKEGRTRHGTGGGPMVLIPIKKDLYISCRLWRKPTEAYEAYPECEKAVEMLKEGLGLSSY